jgi:glycosyltransferase involved in cell wall biosynthesis
LSTHILLDLSRLLWRAERFAPTGIDRVELAYAKHFMAPKHEHVSFTGHWGRLGLLPDNRAAAFIEALDAVWSGTLVDRRARARVAVLARSLRAQLLLRGEGPLYGRTRARGSRHVYLLVSHHGLVRPTALIRFKERTGARFVVLVHDLIPIKHPEYVRWGDPERHRRRMNTVARLADRVIVNSAGTAAALERHFEQAGRAVPIRVVPLGIDLCRPARPLLAVAESPYFVCVATIEPRKNHLLLLDIWRDLAAMLGTNAPRLVLIGRRGWKSRKIIDLIEQSGLARSLVQEHNDLPDAAVARLVLGARALLYPSFAEGYGLPVAEALALGVPVLCSDLPELREIGCEVPEYLDPLDRSAWRDATLDYTQTASIRRQRQLLRLAGWRPPSWERHFSCVEPLIDLVPT